MKNGICSRCDSESVYVRENGIDIGDKAGNIMVYTGMINRVCRSIAFVCTKCGYFEVYIHDAGKLQEIEQKWEKVTVR